MKKTFFSCKKQATLCHNRSHIIGVLFFQRDLNDLRKDMRKDMTEEDNALKRSMTALTRSMTEKNNALMRSMTEKDNALRTELKVGHVIVTYNVMLFPSHLSHFLSHCLL